MHPIKADESRDLEHLRTWIAEQRFVRIKRENIQRSIGHATAILKAKFLEIELANKENNSLLTTAPHRKQLLTSFLCFPCS
ncbi:hypothetical protein FRC0190_00064 [Corynebacterium rouxii]|uniref:Uncharacterized protein n=1 Tax=Corynebacterium rouxii TaxID=2719119 RepID=A0A6I8MFF2_9CORY|nr:hypothetical protein FRC0190_00064 [Corynebacterium rouxii]